MAGAEKDWLLKQLREAMAELPGTDFAFTQPIEMRTSEMLTGSRGNLAVKIFGPDLRQLAELAGRIKAVISEVKGAAEVMTTSNGMVDYLQVSLDRLAAGRTKLSLARIQDELRAMLEGTPAGVVVEPGRRTNIIIRGPQDVRERPNIFAKMQLAAGDGGLVAVADIAQLERRAGPVKIDRENASRFAIVQAYVAGRDLVGFVEDAQRAIAAEVQLPPGYRLVWGGEFENQRRAAARLSVVVPIALGLIFLVLFATLRSMRQSLLILTNVPFAMIGGMISLWLSGEYLSVPASVGFIALLGIAVLNGLVLVSHFNQLLVKGVALEIAVFDGALRRLRPVLMTASIAAFGLIPLLFATGPGSEIQKPLAAVVIGGTRYIDAAHARPAADPVSSIRRHHSESAGPDKESAMDQPRCKLTLVYPLPIEEEIVNLVLSQNRLAEGFTTWRAEGHGHGFNGASANEKVRGRIDRGVLVSVLPRSALSALLEHVRAVFGGSQFGVLGRTRRAVW